MRFHVLHSTGVGFLIAGLEEAIHLGLLVGLFEDLAFLATTQTDGVLAL